MGFCVVCFQKKILGAGVERLESDSQAMKEETTSLIQGLGDPEKQKVTAGNSKLNVMVKLVLHVNVCSYALPVYKI